MEYRGASIEKELNGTYSVYYVGNPYATTGGFKSIEEAKRYVDWGK